MNSSLKVGRGFQPSRARRFFGWLFLVACLTIFPCVQLSAQETSAQETRVGGEPVIPKPGDRVYDPSNALGTMRAALVQKLAALQGDKGAEIGVVVLPSLVEVASGLPIEPYTLKVAEYWKLGRPGIDDGVILLLALKEKRIRIEVGRGLEGAIPDITAKRIINKIIVPRLKQGDVPGGVMSGVEALISAISGEMLPVPKRENQEDQSGLLIFIGAALVFAGGLVAVGWGILVGAGVSGVLAFVVASIVLSVSSALLYALLIAFVTAASNVFGGSSPFGGGGFGGYSSYGGGGGGFGGFGSGGTFSGGGASGEW